jgi:hypothetical protein
MAAPGHLKILSNTLDLATRGDTITVTQYVFIEFSHVSPKFRSTQLYTSCPSYRQHDEASW